MPGEQRVAIRTDADIVAARQQGRRLAGEAGFGSVDSTLIATAISELARNVIQYAREGEIRLVVVEEGARRGLQVVVTDSGPGIQNVPQAMQDGFSTTRNSLGIGLPGARRMMDDFDIVSEIGHGTTITMRKWKR